VIRPGGERGSADTAFALAEAVLEMRAGGARNVVVASGAGRSVAAAVHLER
jgi:hypothetical protein